MILFFVTPPDTTDEATGKVIESEPLLRGGGVRAEDCWPNLANARAKLTGEPCDPEQLRQKMEAEGYRILKYDARPANA